MTYLSKLPSGSRSRELDEVAAEVAADAPDQGVAELVEAARARLAERARRDRELLAELYVLDRYDRTRIALGHDFGCGQRGAELSRRRRDVGSLDGTPVTRDELSAAYVRVGRPRRMRAERDFAKYGSKGARLTLKAWRVVELSILGEAARGAA